MRVEAVPLLLTRQDALPRAIDRELQRLNPDTVLVLGGPSAVSDDVPQELRDLRERD